MLSFLLSLPVEVIVSLCLASFGLDLVEAPEARFIKIVVFSRAFQNGVYMFGKETGIY